MSSERIEKFTPGPWKVEFEDIECCEDDPHVYVVHCKTVSPDTALLEFNITEENVANAHLISAAPEMYEALKLAYGIIYQAAKNSFEAEDILNRFDSVLKKARGEECTK